MGDEATHQSQLPFRMNTDTKGEQVANLKWTFVIW